MNSFQNYIHPQKKSSPDKGLIEEEKLKTFHALL